MSDVFDVLDFHLEHKLWQIFTSEEWILSKTLNYNDVKNIGRDTADIIQYAVFLDFWEYSNGK